MRDIRIRLLRSFSAFGLLAFAALGVNYVHAQFSAPTCLPPNCNPSVIQNIAPAGTAQTANINVSGTVKSGTLIGDGAGVTNLNASSVVSGTLNDARLSANVPLLNAANAFTAANNFSAAGNSFTGSGANLTALNANQLTTGTVADLRLTANVPLKNANNAFTGNNTFSSVSNSYFGSGANLTALNATQLTSGTLPSARLSGTYSNALTLSGNNTYGGMSTFGSAGLALGNGQNLIYGVANTGTGTAKLLLLERPSASAMFSVDYNGNLFAAGSGAFSGNVTVAGQSVCRADGTNCPPSSGINGTVNYLSKFTSATAVGNSQIQDNGTNLGIAGAPTGTDKVTVYGNVYAKGLVTGYNTAGNGVYGQSTSAGGIGVTGTGSGYGVYGFTTTAGAEGVYGSNTGGAAGAGVTGWSNGFYGVRGISTATASFGVYGSGVGTGVYGIASSGSGAGVNGTSPHYGIYAQSTGTGLTDYGLVATIPAGSTASAVAGFAGSSPGNGVYGVTTGAGSGVFGFTSGTFAGGAFQTGTVNGTALVATGFGAGKAFRAQGDSTFSGSADITGYLTVGNTFRLGSFAGDPVGVNGMMYYNTSGKFRCFEGAAWKDCLGAGGAISGSPNFIPKFMTASTVGNSIMSENSGVITVTGTGVVTGTLTANGATADATHGLSAQGSVAGVYGVPTGAGGVGVYGTNNGLNAGGVKGDGMTYGVSGVTTAGDGVYGIATTGNAVHGNATTGRAGYFEGAVAVTGNTTLGDAGSDALTITGTAVSVPNNLNIDANTLYVDATNNRVGIGTATPARKLDVYDAAGFKAQFKGGDNVDVLLDRGSDTRYANVQWASAGTLHWALGLRGVDDDSLYFHDEDAGVSKMMIDGTTGNVGINTLSPFDKLDVNGSITLSGGAKEIRFRNAGGSVEQFIWHSGTMLGLGPGSSTNSVFITSGGDVGINTQTPDTQLHVYGGSDLNSAGNGGVAKFEQSSGSLKHLLIDENEIQAYYNGAPYLLHINNDGGTVVLTGGAAGSVGVGLTSPSEKFEVKGVSRFSNWSNGPWVEIATPADTWDFTTSYKTGIVISDALVPQDTVAHYGIQIEIGKGTADVGAEIASWSSGGYALIVPAGIVQKPGGGSWAVYSDTRTKKDVSDFTDSLDILKKIHAINYTYNGLGGTPEGVKAVGVIAQEAQKIVPYMVLSRKGKLRPEDTTETDILSFDASALPFIELNAIKEMDLHIDGFEAKTIDRFERDEARIQKLESEVRDLKARLERLER